MSEFKVGDIVRIKDGGHGDSRGLVYTPYLDSKVRGLYLVIAVVDYDGTLKVMAGDDSWWLSEDLVEHASPIKITKNKTKPRRIVYAYGNEFHVPMWVKFIAIDEDCGVWMYRDKPVADRNQWVHRGVDVGRSRHIGKADLNGVDWRETLVEV